MSNILKFQWNYFIKNPFLILLFFAPSIVYLIIFTLLPSGNTIGLVISSGIFVITYFISATYLNYFNNTHISVTNTATTKLALKRKSFFEHSNINILFSIYLFSLIVTFFSMLSVIFTSFIFSFVPGLPMPQELSNGSTIGSLAAFGTWQRWLIFFYSLIMGSTLSFTISYVFFEWTNRKATYFCFSIIYMILVFTLGGSLNPRFLSNGQANTYALGLNTGVYSIFQYFIPNWYFDQFSYWIFATPNTQIINGTAYFANPMITTNINGYYSSLGMISMTIPWLWSIIILALANSRKLINKEVKL